MAVKRCQSCGQVIPQSSSPILMTTGLPGLKQIRAVRRVSCAAIAEALKVDPTFIFKLESGQRDCNTLFARKLALMLQVDIRDLWRSHDHLDSSEEEVM